MPGLQRAVRPAGVAAGRLCGARQELPRCGPAGPRPHLVPTFQLTLVLRLNSGLWPKIQGLLSSTNSLVLGFSQSLTLSAGFRVIKKKLYSSEQLLIEEC